MLNLNCYDKKSMNLFFQNSLNVDLLNKIKKNINWIENEINQIKIDRSNLEKIKNNIKKFHINFTN